MKRNAQNLITIKTFRYFYVHLLGIYCAPKLPHVVPAMKHLFFRSIVVVFRH